MLLLKKAITILILSSFHIKSEGVYENEYNSQYINLEYVWLLESLGRSGLTKTNIVKQKSIFYLNPLAVSQLWIQH